MEENEKLKLFGIRCFALGCVIVKCKIEAGLSWLKSWKSSCIIFCGNEDQM